MASAGRFSTAVCQLVNPHTRQPLGIVEEFYRLIWIWAKFGPHRPISPVNFAQFALVGLEVDGRARGGNRLPVFQDSAVVGFGAGDDVLDVQFPDAVEPSAGVGVVDAAPGVYEIGFN